MGNPATPTFFLFYISHNFLYFCFMKNLLILLSVSLMIGCSNNRISLNEVTDKDGVIYSINGPYTGVVFSEYENGQLAEESSYKNGILHGISSSWYQNGKLGEQENYTNGLENGIYRKWYFNGQLEKEWNNIHGNRNGINRHFLENGQIKKESKWRDSKAIKYTIWHDNGKLSRVGIYDNGERVSCYFLNVQRDTIDCDAAYEENICEGECAEKCWLPSWQMDLSKY